MVQDEIRFIRPFDTHVHGRQGDLLRAVAPMTARQFAGAIFEPNLAVPITTAKQGRAYREEILRATAGYPDFRPYVLAYLTDTFEPDELARGLKTGDFFGAKFYPQGATTNSGSGIVDVRTLWKRDSRQYSLLRVLADHCAVLQLHCELNFDFSGNELDPYDKEPYFFKEVLPHIRDAHPDLTLSCEHLTCQEGARYMHMNGGDRLGCSITPHHLLYDRRDMFRGGLRPHLFCLPVLKAREHQEALLRLITYGHPFVYAGTDSAPHDRRKKECDCCSGGVFTAHAAVELYAQAFETAGALKHFEAFMSINGPLFYNLPVSIETSTLERRPWTVDEMFSYSKHPEDIVRPHGYEVNTENRVAIPFKLID